MYKLFSIVLAATSLGALSATPAKAGGCCSTCAPSCAAAPSCCATAAPAPANNMQAMPGMSQATSATRSYSYEPSMRSGSASASARAPQVPAYLVPKAQR